MIDKKRFCVFKLSEAAYLDGVHQIQCTAIEIDPDNKDRVVFIFDLEETRGNELVLAFGSSESFRFDNAVKNFKGKLYHKLKRRAQ